MTTSSEVRTLKAPEGQRADDLRALFTLFGVTKAYVWDYDEAGAWPEYIPSGKPWRTHRIDAQSVPHFHTHFSDDFQTFQRVQSTWNAQGQAAFEEELTDLQSRRNHQAAGTRGIPRGPLTLLYQVGDFTRAALNTFSPAFLEPDPPGASQAPQVDDLEEWQRILRDIDHKVQRWWRDGLRLEQQKEDLPARSYQTRMLSLCQDIRGLRKELQRLLLTGSEDLPKR